MNAAASVVVREDSADSVPLISELLLVPTPDVIGGAEVATELLAVDTTIDPNTEAVVVVTVPDAENALGAEGALDVADVGVGVATQLSQSTGHSAVTKPKRSGLAQSARE